ncbi:MAG: SPOR domain-containing protein [Deltaproteobacteria bacterium]|nr:MAG: SPOR domain-containing protein [Deltaproteobacteria bacterium]
MDRKKRVVIGLIVLVVLTGWLLWSHLREKPEPEPLPVVRYKVIRQVPQPLRPADADRSASKASQVKTGGLQLEMKAEADPAPPEKGGVAAQKAESETPQSPTPEEVKTDTEDTKNRSDTKVQSESKKTETTEQPAHPTPRRRIIIQVGAFRKLAGAESVQKRLQKQGYDAYLDSRTIPKLGLLHRVRISGYTSVAEARTDMKELREAGLDSFILRLKPDSKASDGDES